MLFVIVDLRIPSWVPYQQSTQTSVTNTVRRAHPSMPQTNQICEMLTIYIIRHFCTKGPVLTERHPVGISAPPTLNTPSAKNMRMRKYVRLTDSPKSHSGERLFGERE